MPRLTFHTSFKVEGSKVKVIRPLNAVTENHSYLRNGKPARLVTTLGGGGGTLLGRDPPTF